MLKPHLISLSASEKQTENRLAALSLHRHTAASAIGWFFSVYLLPSSLMPTLPPVACHLHLCSCTSQGSHRLVPTLRLCWYGFLCLEGPFHTRAPLVASSAMLASLLWENLGFRARHRAAESQGILQCPPLAVKQSTAPTASR